MTWYQSQCQRLPRAMIGPFYDDQMVVLGQRYKQNAINVSGNESKLENVYMGIKIVKTCFLDICQVLYSEYQPVKMDIFDICHWKTRSYDLGKGQKRVIYFIVSFGIYNLLKSGYFTHG